MAAEGKLRKKLKDRIEAHGGEIRAVSWVGRRNAPDVLALFPDDIGEWLDPSARPGTHTFVETKGVEPDAREAQKREHERLRKAGCTVVVIRNEAELDAWLPPL